MLCVRGKIIVTTIFVLRVIAFKRILLSKQKDSSDNSTCGTERKPCATLEYALYQLINQGGVLEIDGGTPLNKYAPYVFNTARRTIIKGSLHIKSRVYHENGEQIKPTIFINSWVFDILGNLTIESININPFVFNVTGNVEITNSNFRHKTQLITWPHKQPHLKISNTCVTLLYIYNTIHLILMLDGITIKTFNVIFNNRNVLVKNSIFFSLPNSTRSIFHYREDRINVALQIRNCSFVDTNVQVINQRVKLINSIFNRTTNAVRIRNSRVIGIDKCSFDGAGLIIHRAKFTVISRSKFKNLLPLSKTSAITVSGKIHAVHIENCVFKNNSAALGVPSALNIKAKVLTLKNINITGSYDDKILVDIALESTFYNGSTISNITNTKISCANGQFIEGIHIKNGNKGNRYSYYMKVFCKKCPIGSYSLISGILELHGMKGKKVNIECKPCPFGGICNNKLHSNGGYWGYVIQKTQPEVRFMQCPALHCCETPSRCKSYNTCSSNREGRLCSKCKQGFTSSMTNQARCVSNERCGNLIFIAFAYLSAALVYLCFILYLKEIMVTIKRILWKRSHPTNDRETDEQQIELNERLLPECFERGLNNHRYIPYQMLLHKDVPFMEYPTIGSKISGSLKVIFFFYQAASTIRVQTSAKFKISFPFLLDIINSVFNVQLNLNYSKTSLCFMRNLQNIQISLLNQSFYAVMLFTTVLLLMLLKTYTCFYSGKKNIQQVEGDDSTPHNNETTFKPTRIDKNIAWYNKVPFDVRLKCGYLQIFLLVYTGISTFAFQCVHCVKIKEQLYLFRQASISCYQPWQIAVWIFICAWVIPFPMVLYFLSRQLYECQIGPNEFLLTATFPPLIICKIIYRKVQKRNFKNLKKEDAMLSKHILMLLSEPFRETENGEQLCWETILMLRRVILVVIHTFISSPIQRMLPSVIALLLFLVHSHLWKPYKDSVVNTLEMSSLLVLISLSFFNYFWAFTDEYDLMASQKYYIYGKVMIYFELVIVALPIIVLIFAIIAYLLKRLIE